MASITISSDNNNIICNWDTFGCDGVIYTSLYLYKDTLFYLTTNQTGSNYTFEDVPVGSSYYVIAEIYTTGPTLCVIELSNTINIVSYCIPSGQLNIKFSDLVLFYGLNNSNILLSGPNNPSSINSIFGNSALPNTGTISKTRPNAVSELRNSCGGIVDIYNFAQNSFVTYKGQIAENILSGFLQEPMPSGVDLYSPLYPGDPWAYCANFIDSKSGEQIMQTNGVYGVETIGSKTIKIAFSRSNNRSLPLVLGLSGSIIVKRLSDNTIVASTSINIPANSNSTYTLTWSNPANNTKIGIIIDVSQVCAV